MLGGTRHSSGRNALTDRWQTGLPQAPAPGGACLSRGRCPAPSSTTLRTKRRSPRPPVPRPGPGSVVGVRAGVGVSVRRGLVAALAFGSPCAWLLPLLSPPLPATTARLYPLGRHERGAPRHLVLLEGGVELGRVEVVVDVARLGGPGNEYIEARQAGQVPRSGAGRAGWEGRRFDGAPVS